MVDPDIVARRVLTLNEALQDLAASGATDADKLASNRTLRAAVERWLQVAIDACADIAFHVVADEGWTPVEATRDAFMALATHGRISLDLARRLGRAAGLRNVLVHEYVDVDLETLGRVVREDLGDLREFGRIAASWLS